MGTGTGSGTFSSVTDNGDGTYTATFTGTTAGTNTITATIDGQPVTSTAPTITVATAPVVTLNPTNQIADSGNTVTLTAAAVGDPAPTVQWQISTDGGSTYTNITGATSPSYTFTANASAEYQAVFTNSAGLAASSGHS